MVAHEPRGGSRWGLDLALGIAGLSALVVWYVEAADAHLRTVGFVHYVGIAPGALIVAGVAFARSRRVGRRRIGDAAVAGAVAAFVSWVTLAGLNVWLDGSVAEERRGEVLAIHSPSKGPPMLVVRSGARELSVPRELAPSCARGRIARLGIRAGALGGEWVERVACDAEQRPSGP